MKVSFLESIICHFKKTCFLNLEQEMPHRGGVQTGKSRELHIFLVFALIMAFWMRYLVLQFPPIYDQS